MKKKTKAKRNLWLKDIDSEVKDYFFRSLINTRYISQYGVSLDRAENNWAGGVNYQLVESEGIWKKQTQTGKEKERKRERW